MKINMIIEKTKTGYSAYAENYPVYTAGSSMEELKTKALESLKLYFEQEDKTIKVKDMQIKMLFPSF